MRCPDLRKETAEWMGNVISLNSSQVSSALLKSPASYFLPSPLIFIYLFILDLTNGWKWRTMIMGFGSHRGSVGEEMSRVNESHEWCWLLLAMCITNRAQRELWPEIKSNYCQICRHIQLIGFTKTSNSLSCQFWLYSAFTRTETWIFLSRRSGSLPQMTGTSG